MNERYYKIRIQRVRISAKGVSRYTQTKYVTAHELKDLRQNESISAMKKILKVEAITAEEYIASI